MRGYLRRVVKRKKGSKKIIDQVFIMPGNLYGLWAHKHDMNFSILPDLSLQFVSKFVELSKCIQRTKGLLLKVHHHGQITIKWGDFGVLGDFGQVIVFCERC